MPRAVSSMKIFTTCSERTRNMNILVLMKQVVSDQEPGILEDGFILDRGSAGLDVNPTDCAALEHALAVKEACGGTVTVLSMGSRRAEPMLREILALPVDRVVLLTDRIPSRPQGRWPRRRGGSESLIFTFSAGGRSTGRPARSARKPAYCLGEFPASRM